MLNNFSHDKYLIKSCIGKEQYKPKSDVCDVLIIIIIPPNWLIMMFAFIKRQYKKETGRSTIIPGIIANALTDHINVCT